MEQALRDAIEKERAPSPTLPTVAEYFPPGSTLVLSPDEDRFDRWTEAFKSSPAKTFREWAEAGLDALADQELGKGNQKNGTQG